MPLIKWDDALFSVHNEELDSHHKKIVDLINQLHTAMMKRTGVQTLPVILAELKSYIDYHFKAEEKMMRLAGFPDYDEHKLKHSEFVDQLSQILQKHEWGSREVGIDTIELLKEWLFKHIQMSDKKYVPYLKN